MVAFRAWYDDFAPFPGEDAVAAVRSAEADQSAEALYWRGLAELRAAEYAATEKERVAGISTIARSAALGHKGASAMTSYYALQLPSDKSPEEKRKTVLLALASLAKQEVPEALLCIGYIYRDGTGGVPVDLDRASRSFLAAVELGHKRSNLEVARTLQRMGQFDRAFKAAKAAADAGDPNACYELGLWHLNGQFGVKDQKAAEAFFAKGAAASPAAAVEWARMAITRGELRDAATRLASAAERGYPPAIVMLARLAIIDEAVPNADLEAVRETLEPLAAARNAPAMALLGYGHAFKVWAQPDRDLAVRLLQQAAKLGDPDAALWIATARRQRPTA